jgi:hypothetical protein
LLGQKSDSEQQDQSQEQDQAAQADATEPVMTPEMLAHQDYQNSLFTVFSKAKDLVIGKFFKSILNKATGEVQIDKIISEMNIDVKFKDEINQSLANKSPMR